MRRVAVILIFVTLAAVGCSPTVPKRGDMTPFPVAPGGETRHVIRLPAAGDEDYRPVKKGQGAFHRTHVGTLGVIDKLYIFDFIYYYK